MPGSYSGPTIHEVQEGGVTLSTAGDKVEYWTPRPVNIIRFGVVLEGAAAGSDLVLSLGSATCTVPTAGTAAGDVVYRDRQEGDVESDWRVDVGGGIIITGDGGPTSGNGTVFFHYIEEPVEHNIRGGANATPVTS